MNSETPSKNSSETGPYPPGYFEDDAPNFAQQVRIADCTLRDGEQQAGVVLRRDEKIQFAEALASLGVYEIEAGTPAVSDEDAEAVRAIAAADLGPRVSALSRAIPSEIDWVASLGVWGIRLSLPISGIQRKSKLPLGDDEYIDLALRCTERAKELGLYVIFSPYDTTRVEHGFLEKVLARLRVAGTVDRIRVVDTAGCSTPAEIAFLTKMVSQQSGAAVEVHCHDDFGLATANTIAGAAAGAEYVSVTVNGIGERAGNAALEEVVAALEILYSVPTGIEMPRLVGLSRLLEQLSAVGVSPQKSVVGRGAFSHESGAAVAGVIANPFAAEAYAPGLVGQTRQIVLGKMSGLASVRWALAQRELTADEDQERDLLVWVKAFAEEHKRVLTDAEFDQKVTEALGVELPARPKSSAEA